MTIRGGARSFSRKCLGPLEGWLNKALQSRMPEDRIVGSAKNGFRGRLIRASAQERADPSQHVVTIGNANPAYPRGFAFPCYESHAAGHQGVIAPGINDVSIYAGSKLVAPN